MDATSGSFPKKISRKLSDADPKFAAFYQEKIAPHLAFAEQSRIEHLSEFYSRLMISIPLCLVWLAFIGFLYWSDSWIMKIESDTLTAVLFSPLFGCGVWCHRKIKSFELSIKSKIYSEIFNFFGDFQYEPAGSGLEGVNLREKFGIIPAFSKAKTEDLIIGEYSGVGIVFEEWMLDQRKGDDERNVFKGATLSLGFNKNFSGQTIIKHSKGKIRNFTANLVNRGTKDLEKVSLEDWEFAKKFEVFSSDQIEARYLITPALMNRLLNLTKFFNAKSFDAGFADNSLFVMFKDSENLFEVRSIFKEIDLVGDSLRVVDQIKLIFEIIDYLKINQRTGI